jgi:hypothetical protein
MGHLSTRLDCTDPAGKASRPCRSVDIVARFLRAHWDEIDDADFFTTEVWTWRGLVTFYTVFVIERVRM